jgi:hypothetical protein
VSLIRYLYFLEIDLYSAGPTYRITNVEDGRRQEANAAPPPRPSRSSLRSTGSVRSRSRSPSLSPLLENLDFPAPPTTPSPSYAISSDEPSRSGREPISVRRGWKSMGDVDMPVSRRSIMSVNSSQSPRHARSKSWSRPTSTTSFAVTPALTRSSSISKFEVDDEVPALSPTTSTFAGLTSCLPTPIEASHPSPFARETPFDENDGFDGRHTLLISPLEFSADSFEKPRNPPPRLRHSTSTPSLVSQSSIRSNASLSAVRPDVKSDWDESDDESSPALHRRRDSIVKRMKSFRIGLPKWKSGASLTKVTEVDV